MNMDEIKKQEAVVAEAQARNLQLALERDKLRESWSIAREKEQDSYDAWETEFFALQRMKAEGQQ